MPSAAVTSLASGVGGANISSTSERSISGMTTDGSTPSSSITEPPTSW